MPNTNFKMFLDGLNISSLSSWQHACGHHVYTWTEKEIQTSHVSSFPQEVLNDPIEEPSKIKTQNQAVLYLFCLANTKY